VKLARFAVRHTVYMTLILIALFFFAIFSFSGMNVQFISDVNTATVYVVAIYPGATAEDVETDVIDVMEENFATLPHFKSMDSVSSDNVGVVTIKYVDGTDPYDEIDELRARINTLMKDLPDGLSGTPEVQVGGIDMLPVYTFTVESGDDIIGLTRYVEDELKPRLTKIDGVSTVGTTGGYESEVKVTLDIDELDSKGISPLTVYQILQYSNRSIPLGSTEYQGKNTSVRFNGSYDSIDDIENLTVGSGENGELIKLRDVATVEITSPEVDVIATKDNKNAICVEVSKRSGGNTVGICNAIDKIIEEEEANSNGALQFSLIAKDSRMINASMSAVISSGVMGVLIAIFVILLCLGSVRDTLTIAISMPLSVLFAFIIMRLTNVPISLMSLSGLVIALGSIVGGSIVMLEEADKDYYKLGPDGKNFFYTVNEAIYSSADTVTMSILGSTLTTIVVFIPICALDGIVGMILHDVAISFMAALAGSAIVAIAFVPYFLKKFLPEDRKPRKETKVDSVMHKMENAYGAMVDWCLNNRKFLIVICIVILILTGRVMSRLGMAFLPSTDNSEFYVNISYPTSYTLEKTKEKMDEAEAVIRETVPEVNTVLTVSGKQSGITFGTNDYDGYIRVVLVPVAERDRDIHDIMNEVKYALDERIPGATVNVKNGGYDNLVSYITDGGGYGLELEGDDTELLYSEAERIKHFLEQDDEVMSAAVNTSYDSFSAAIRASSDYMASLGLTSYEAGMTSAILFNGVDSGNYTDPSTGDRLGIRLESNITDVELSDDTLSSISVTTQQGKSVSFSSITDLELERNISSIHHSDRANTVTVSAVLTGESTTSITRKVNAYLEEHPLAEGITTNVGGVGTLINESMGPMVAALVIAFFLVFVVMVMQFESFKQPILILITIPFTIIGVGLSLLVAGSTMNIISILGVVSLFGTAVNNGIILIDRMNLAIKETRIAKLQDAGEKVDEDTVLAGRFSYEEDSKILYDSIIFSCKDRLRAILMTTLSAMLGVVPMAVGTGEGSELYAPLGQVMAGGLLETTAVSLFLVPVLYYLMERRQLKRIYRRKK